MNPLSGDRTAVHSPPHTPGTSSTLRTPGTSPVTSTPSTLGTPRTLRTSTPGTPGTLGTPDTLRGEARRAPQLDGLRAIAVLAVAWSHWERPYQFGIPFGAGVHLFYVLSGFLITGILLQVRDRSDRGAGVTAFYIRRALRIFPAFYLTLALAWIADVPPVRETFWWHALYASNVQVVVSGEWPGAISHFWSLAVEEQFYLVWPWLIVWAPRRWLAPAIVAAIAVAPLFRLWLATLGYRETLLGVLTPGSLDSLGVGALLALMRGSSRDAASAGTLPATLDRYFPLAAAGATAAWLVMIIVEAAGTLLPLPLLAIKQTMQAVVFGWVVVGAASGFRGLTGRVLAAGPTVYIGRISYGVYLAHGFAGAMLATLGVSSHALDEPLRFIVLSGVTVGAAALSWHLLEAPLNALKTRFPVEKHSSNSVNSLNSVNSV